MSTRTPRSFSQSCFPGGWPFISPIRSWGFQLYLQSPGEDPVDLIVSGAVQCADLVTATSCGGTDPWAACGQSLSPTKRSQMCRMHSPSGAWSKGRSLMYKGCFLHGGLKTVSCYVSAPLESPGRSLVSLWAPIAVPAACCCSVLVVHISTNVACS